MDHVTHILSAIEQGDAQAAEQLLPLVYDELRKLAAARLAREEPQAAQVVQLRYFAGVTTAVAAATLGISVRTANRHWAYAKAWLYHELRQGDTQTH